MKINLSPFWELSTEHAASSDGRPVLVNKTTGEAFGPGDTMKPYLSYGFMSAREAVRRLARTQSLDEEELALVGQFIKGTKGDERQ